MPNATFDVHTFSRDFADSLTLDRYRAGAHEVHEDEPVDHAVCADPDCRLMACRMEQDRERHRMAALVGDLS